MKAWNLAILVVLGGTLIGCGSAPTVLTLEDTDPGEQMVTYWYRRSNRQEEDLMAMIDEFNAANEWGIVVRGEFVGTDEIGDRITAGIPTGKVPDLAVVQPHQAAVYASQGAVVDLTPYIESEKWGLTQQDLEDFYPFVLQVGFVPRLQGRYPFPRDCTAEVLYYNEDWLHELGYERPPLSWGEFEEMACAASDAEAGTYGYEFSVDAFTFADMLLSRGGRMVGESGAAYTFGDEVGLASLVFLRDLHDKGCAVAEREWHGAEADFGAGKVLFTIDSTASLPRYRDAVAARTGFAWSVTSLPVSDTLRVGVHSENVAIFRTTPERQLAAWLFVRWFSEPEQQARWAGVTGALPLRSSAADLLRESIVENPQYGAALDLLGNGSIVEPGVSGYDVCQSEIAAMLAAVVDGEGPVEQLAQAARKCDASK